jgi:hypothetical protein
MKRSLLNSSLLLPKRQEVREPRLLKGLPLQRVRHLVKEVLLSQMQNSQSKKKKLKLLLTSLAKWSTLLFRAMPRSTQASRNQTST